MDMEIIVRQLKNNARGNIARATKWYEQILKKYESLPLTLPITDSAMQRVCQVLTNYRYKTTESCEGHGKQLPNIFFQCDDQVSLRDLAHIVERELHNLNHFPWQIRAWSSDPYLNPESKLAYVLEPALWRGEINPQTAHPKLLEDLDFIGMEVISYFNIPWRFKEVDETIASTWKKLYGKEE